MNEALLKEFTRKEVKVALNNRDLGPDGLSVVFYKT